jgi:hypothetical protein
MAGLRMTDEQKKFVYRTLIDLSRQFLSLIPMLLLYLVSKSEVYLSVVLLTSATTLASAVFIVGINFLVSMKARRDYIGLSTTYLVLVSPLTAIVAAALYLNTQASELFSFLTIVFLVFGEVMFSLVQQTLSRYALAEWRAGALALANIVSPTLRAIAFLLLTSSARQTEVSLSYFISQTVLTFFIIKVCRITFDLKGLAQTRFRLLLKAAVPNWLSSLGVTSVDNLAIFAIAYLLNAEMAASLILVLRIFGVASSPVQTIAAIKLSSSVRSLKAEVSLAIMIGLLACLISYSAIFAFSAIALGGSNELYVAATTLILFPLLRTCNTFFGNYLTVQGAPWPRVSASALALTSLSVSLLFIEFAVGAGNGLVMFAVLPVLISELTLLMVLSFGIRAVNKSTQNVL